MVDFQSRDTDRGLDGGDEDEDGGDDAASAAETAEENHAEDDHDHGDGGHDEDHGHHDHDREALGVSIITISSTRTREDDPAGDAAESILEDAGHEVVVRDVVRDDFDGIQNVVDAVVGRSDVDCVVTTGGTGVTPDDVTVEAVEPLFEKELPGFGELFRRLSYDDIGTKVVGTRATAGVADGAVVFCLPGSEAAVRLGTDEIVTAEAPHLAGLAQRE